MADSPIYNRYNTDDIFNRSVIAGLLNLMNNQIKYEQIWQNNVVETVSVPCAFDMVNSDNERFLQDNYTFFGRACFGGNKIDGKFDMLPRTLIRYTGSAIDAGNITNRFIKGNYLKNENGKLTSYTAFMYCIPISMSFECETWFDSLDTGFKIEQMIRETFYKNRTFNVLYRGLKIGCRVGFPEQDTIEKAVSFSFDAERQHKMKFNLAIECYQPCFDNSVAIETGNKIEYIGVDYSHYTDGVTPLDKKVGLKLLDPSTSITIPAGLNYQVTWDASCNVSDMCTVSLSYILDGQEHQIATPLYNQGFYIWYVPESITNYVQPDITYLGIDSADIITKPVIKITPNDNKEFDTDSFLIVNPGLFSNIQNNELKFLMEYIDDKGNTVMSDYTEPYKFIIRNRKIDSVVVPSKLLKYTKTVEKTKISLKLTYPLDRTIFDKVDNILII